MREERARGRAGISWIEPWVCTVLGTSLEGGDWLFLSVSDLSYWIALLLGDDERS